MAKRRNRVSSHGLRDIYSLHCIHTPAGTVSVASESFTGIWVPLCAVNGESGRLQDLSTLPVPLEISERIAGGGVLKGTKDQLSHGADSDADNCRNSRQKSARKRS